jgi:hypothetical protein
LQRLVRHRGVTGTENHVGPKRHVDLGFEGFLNVDLGDDAKPLGREGIARATDRVVERGAYRLGEIVGHLALQEVGMRTGEEGAGW